MKNGTDHYAFRVIWSEEDEEFVGLCERFPSLSWLEKDAEAARVGIIRLVHSIARDEEEFGRPS